MKLWGQFVAWLKKPSPTNAYVDAMCDVVDDAIKDYREREERRIAERKRIAAMPRECSTCRFCNVKPDCLGSPRSECRIRSPMPNVNSYTVCVGRNFPIVHTGDLCGEWKPKK